MLGRTLLALFAIGQTVSSARADALATLEEEQTALFEHVAPAVVAIRSGDVRSAGFAVAPGLVVTAAHSIRGEREVGVSLYDGRAVRGEVIAIAPDGLDLALVRIPATPARVLELGSSTGVRTGSVVAVVGHGEGLLWSLSTGLVAKAEPVGPDAALLALQVPLRPGASGGPVVDRSGLVVGVVAQGAGGIAFAVRADAVRRAFPQIPAATASAAATGPSRLLAADAPDRGGGRRELGVP